MAVVSVSFDGQRMHDMGDTDTTTGIGASSGGASPGTEPDFFYQASNAISKKVGTSANGVDVDTSAFGTPRSVDVTAADRGLWFIKAQATNFKALDPLGTPSGVFWAGSSSTAFYELEAFSSDPDFYPVVGGFNLQVWDMDNADYRDRTQGSPTMTAVDYFAFECDFSASSRAENVILDAIDVGIGLCLTGGDSTDPDGVWQDFVDADEGTSSNRWGCFATKEGIIYVLGMHWIGRTTAATTTATVFYDDFNRTLVFPNSFFDAGDAGVSIDLGNATTDVDWLGSALIGRGTGNRILFDTENDMNATSDEIQVQEMIDAYRPGDAIVVRSLGGTETPGPTNGTTYYVGIDQTATATGITLHTTKNDAMVHSGSGGGTPVALTLSTAGNGEYWRIDKKIDTRPVLTCTGTSGAFNMFGGSLVSFADITLTSVCDLDGVLIQSPESITQAGGRLDSCVINNQTTVEAEHLIDSNDLVDIVSNSFDNTGGRGHAIRGTQTGSVGFVGNTYTGYFSVTDQTKHQFDNTTAVNGTTNVITLPTGHGYVTGDPIVYSKMLTANTAITGLTDQTTYFLSVSTDDVQLHLNEGDAVNGNAPIGLTTGTGNETHALWPANAAFFNDSGGATTLSISGGGATPSVRNALDTTTTVQNAVTLTVQVNDADGNAISGARVRIENASTGAQISQGSTNASGTYTDATYNYSGDLAITTKVRLKGYKNFRTGGTITGNGLSVGVTLATDNIVDLP
jgi:hypothetical protein